MASQGAAEKKGKALLRLLEKALLKAPEVHGHKSVPRQLVPGLPAVGGKASSLAVLLNALLLHDVLQHAVLTHPAHAPGDAAVLGEGLPQAVAYHGVLEAVGTVRVMGQIVVQDPECLGAVVVVGVDDGKGAVDQMAGRQHRVGGSPGL